MRLDNGIPSCYFNQAQNLFNKNFGKNKTTAPESVNIKQAGQLFHAIKLDSKNYKNSKLTYLKKTDTNGDGFISVAELAKVLERADKEAWKNSKDPLDTMDKDDQIASAMEIQEDFNKHGAIPYLLTEAKAQTPEIYKQIKNKLEEGDFTITGEKPNEDSNLLRESINGSPYTEAINETIGRYEVLAQKAPSLRKTFLYGLANGQVPFFNMDLNEKTNKITFSDRQVDEKGRIYLTMEDFDRKNATSLATMSDSIRSESIHDIVPAVTYTTAVGRVYKNPEAEATAKKICENILTDNNLQYVDEHILEAIDNPQKFKELTKKFEKPMQKLLGINIPIVVSKTEEDYAGQYDYNQINIDYKNIKELKNSLEQAGVPSNKMKEYLAKNLLGIISHEYWHAKQDSLGKIGLQSDVSKKYNLKNDYISAENSIRAFGDARRYNEQPIENSAFIVNAYIHKYITKWYAKRNSAAPN